MTVGDLIEQLGAHPKEAEVNLLNAPEEEIVVVRSLDDGKVYIDTEEIDT